MDDTDRGWSEPALDTAAEITNGAVPVVDGALAATDKDLTKEVPAEKGDVPAAAAENDDASAAAAQNGDAPAAAAENATAPAVAEGQEEAPPDTVASRALALEQSLGVVGEPPVSAVEPHAPTEPHPALLAVPNGAGPANTDVPAPNGAARSAEVAAALQAAQAVVDALPSGPAKVETSPKADITAPTLVPRPAATTPYVSIPPPATVPSVGSVIGAPVANFSSAPPVVVTQVRSGSPVPITEADLADELRVPGMFASFGRAKPGSPWLALGGLAVLLAFGGGLALGRGTAPAPLPPVPVPAAAAPVVEAKPSPAAAPTESPTPTAEPSAASTAAATADATRPSEPAAPSLAAAVEAKLGGASKDDGKASGSGTFNAKAAKTNLELSGGRAAKCHVAGDPAGPVTAAVTFGTNGRVTDVNVTSKGFAGTKTAQCIANKLRTTRAPSFSGSPETLNTVVTLRSAR